MIQASGRSLSTCGSTRINHLLGLDGGTVVKVWMLGVLEYGESFDSCITATLTLYRFKNSPNSVSLLPMPFALNCMMVNEFPSTACVGVDVGIGCCFGRVGGQLHQLHTQSLIRLYSAAFWRPEHFDCTHPEQRLHK